MNWREQIKRVKGLPLLGLLVTIFVSSMLLIVINYYTLKIMSSVRAYINGESHYSKGEKDATYNLIAFIHSKDQNDWDDFLMNMEIPQGDSTARVNLISGGPEKIIVEGFLKGNNHSEDIDEMIWLFKTFEDVPLMKVPIAIWEKGDSLIYQKYRIAFEIKAAVDADSIEFYQNDYLEALGANSTELTIKEREFSESLGIAARQIRDYLFYTNVLFVVLILGSVTLYVNSMLKRLRERNADLAHANKELDKLAYGISHDLRAPIRSMLGLVDLAKRETEPSRFKDYLVMMQGALDKQERYIKEMITLSKESRYAVKKEIVELDYLVDQVIHLHEHMPEAKDVKFKRNINIHRVFTDSHRLEIILNNLVSNAIKYHDQDKEDKFIEINTSSENDKIRIDVVDNGVGIDAKDKAMIFEMYYMSKNRDKGSGLGLFIVKEALAKINGEVEVKSTKGEGATFSIILDK